MDIEQIRLWLLEQVRSGRYVAALRDDGSVGYWPVDKATATQLANRLTVNEVRAIGLSALGDCSDLSNSVKLVGKGA
jgi:hypothetical protein